MNITCIYAHFRKIKSSGLKCNGYISNFLGKLKNVSPENKIHLVLDQGSYNKSKKTLKKASDLDIEIHNLPFYSPNFELIRVYLQF